MSQHILDEVAKLVLLREKYADAVKAYQKAERKAKAAIQERFDTEQVLIEAADALNAQRRKLNPEVTP